MGFHLRKLGIKSRGGFTPIDLGSKLLNWWDGTIVDDGTTPGEVDNWLDQKGTIDWLNNGNKATYDDTNNLVIFESAKSEYLTAHDDIAQFNRATGEYWFTLDYIVNAETYRLFTLNSSTANDRYFSLTVFSNTFRCDFRNGGASQTWIGTTSLLAGKNILRVKQDAVAIKIELNGVDITSDDFPNSVGTKWEKYTSDAGVNKVYMNAFIRPSLTQIGNTRYHSLIRIGNVLTTEEATNLYNYLNAKY